MNRCVKSVVLLGLLVVSLYGESQEKDLTVSGIVTDSRTASRLEGARISVVGGKARSDAVSDSEGQFILAFGSDIAIGTLVTVRVEKAGYVPYSKLEAVSSLTWLIAITPTSHGPSSKSPAHVGKISSPIDALSKMGWMVQPGDGASLQFSDIYKHISIRDSAKYFCSVDVPFTVNIVGAKTLDGASGLRGAKYLKKLSLTAPEVSDISELSQLTNLEGVVIGQSVGKISDLSPLRDLTNLRELGIDSPAIRDLTQIQGLRNISVLSIGGTSVSDLTPVSNFRHLRTLSLGGSRVSDLSPISDMNSLEELSINGRQLPALSQLRRLPKLKKLNLYEPTAPLDLTPIASLEELEKLSIVGPLVLDVAPLRGVGTLTNLWITPMAGDFSSLMQLDNISALGELHQLKDLTLFQVRISDLSFLNGLRNLTKIAILNSPVFDIRGIERAEALKEVQFTNTQVFEISPLLSLQDLKDLYVTNTPARSDVLTILERRGVTVHK